MTDVSEDPGDIPQEMRPLAVISNRTLPKAPLSGSTQSDIIDSRQSHDSDRTVSQTSGWVTVPTLTQFLDQNIFVFLLIDTLMLTVFLHKLP